MTELKKEIRRPRRKLLKVAALGASTAVALGLPRCQGGYPGIYDMLGNIDDVGGLVRRGA